LIAPSVALGRSENRVDAVLVTHFGEFGGIAQEWIDFLQDKAGFFVVVQHPLASSGISSASLYVSRVHVRDFVLASHSLPFGLHWLKDLLFTLAVLTRLSLVKGRFELFIGIDCLNALAGILLRRLHLVRHVVFYAIDYAPVRFPVPVMNMLYQLAFGYAAAHADLVWNGSSRIAAICKNYGGRPQRSLIVPSGHRASVNTGRQASDTNPRVVYVGTLDVWTGVELIIESFRLVVDKIPNAKLYMVGTGDLYQQLTTRVNSIGLSRSVVFTGVLSNSETLKLIATCRVGLAPYKPGKTWITVFADVGMKITEYLASGLAVITTRVPRISKEIESAPAGKVIDYDETELAEAIIELLSDDELYLRCRANAMRMMADFHWDSILRRTWDATRQILELSNGAKRIKLPDLAPDAQSGPDVPLRRYSR